MGQVRNPLLVQVQLPTVLEQVISILSYPLQNLHQPLSLHPEGILVNKIPKIQMKAQISPYSSGKFSNWKYFLTIRKIGGF